MTELALTHFLGHRRPAEEGIDLARGEQFHRVEVGGREPFYILVRIEPDAGDDGDEHLLRNPRQVVDAHSLALEIGDAADPFVGKKLKAADMHSRQHLNGRAAGDDADVAGWKIPVEIDQSLRSQSAEFGPSSGVTGLKSLMPSPNFTPTH